jgi:hypothetical protein
LTIYDQQKKVERRGGGAVGVEKEEMKEGEKNMECWE